jgi:hypothetical protein
MVSSGSGRWRRQDARKRGERRGERGRQRRPAGHLQHLLEERRPRHETGRRRRRRARARRRPAGARRRARRRRRAARRRWRPPHRRERRLLARPLRVRRCRRRGGGRGRPLRRAAARRLRRAHVGPAVAANPLLPEKQLAEPAARVGTAADRAPSSVSELADVAPLAAEVAGVAARREAWSAPSAAVSAEKSRPFFSPTASAWRSAAVTFRKSATPAPRTSAQSSPGGMRRGGSVTIDAPRRRCWVIQPVPLTS